MRPIVMAVLGTILMISASLDTAEAGGRWRRVSSPGAGPAIGKWTLPYNDQTKAIICTNRPVPPNWIIVGVRHSPACNGLGENSWVIQRLPNYPGADMIICGNQPVPPGWVVVETVHTAYCGHGVQGLRIRKVPAGTPEAACPPGVPSAPAAMPGVPAAVPDVPSVPAAIPPAPHVAP